MSLHSACVRSRPATRHAKCSHLARVLDAQDATAPAEIAADVKAVNEWNRNRKLPLSKRFDYDLRRLLREGSADDLAGQTYWHPEIRKQDSRVTAYQEQVCQA